MLNIHRQTILVTDGWKGTLAAVKAFRLSKGWTESDLIHEVVNHNAGQITNVNHFTTNHIEVKWSSMKRWLKKLNGGKLPTVRDRQGWSDLLTEYQWRKVHSTASADWNNTFQLNFSDVVKACASYTP